MTDFDWITETSSSVKYDHCLLNKLDLKKNKNKKKTLNHEDQILLQSYIDSTYKKQDNHVIKYTISPKVLLAPCGIM